MYRLPDGQDYCLDEKLCQVRLETMTELAARRIDAVCAPLVIRPWRTHKVLPCVHRSDSLGIEFMFSYI